MFLELFLTTEAISLDYKELVFRKTYTVPLQLAGEKSRIACVGNI
jgi:hypothetical protein